MAPTPTPPPPPPYEHVVIDGDDESTADDDDDDAVLVISPQSRKRRRRSAIMDEDDEGATSQPITAPTNGNNQERHDKEDDKEEEEEDDDDVEIIHVGSRLSPQRSDSASKKKARLTILDSDDEAPAGHEAVERTTTSPTPTRRQSLSSRETPVTAPPSISTSTSSSRRSSRLERQRQEKAERRSGPSPRKLFRSLDNCLDDLSSSRTQRKRGDAIEIDEDVEEEEEEEEEEAAPLPTRRAPPARRETRRRVAEADDDLDEFIVGDDEVEYMDDDEEGVMRSGTDDDDGEVADEEHALDVRESLKSRDPSEWFAIYLQYLEESILDEDLDNKMRRAGHNTQYAVFQQAIHHIERAICSRRDSLRSNVDWGDEIMESLNFATKFVSQRCAPMADCEACRRHNHVASVVANFGGVASDGRDLYRENWMKKLRRSLEEQEVVNARYELGSVCHARLLGYWQFHHAKHFWVALVDAKRREHSDGRGRIADAAREAFYKQEFGRYKRLIGLAERFSEESHHGNFYMPNVWKRVTANYVLSDFLPSACRVEQDSDVPRRGTLDSFVGESEDEEDGEDEQEEEEEEEEIEAVDENDDEEKGVSPASVLDPSTSAKASRDNQMPEPRSTSSPPSKSSSKRKMRQSTLFSAIAGRTNQSPISTPPRQSISTSPHVKNESSLAERQKADDELDADDLLCLVCQSNQRDGAILHGNYLHFYSCFACGKRDLASKTGCRVCDRPIDRVLRVLPLSRAARTEILQQNGATK